MGETNSIILDYFDKINAIPRCSLKEEKLCLWLQQWASDRRLKYNVDEQGNLVVHVPASPGKDQTPTVVIQGHMDMVCEKTPESTHNFDRDSIVSHREGDWLTAKDTTLGADNGIALAYMLAFVDDGNIIHPPLELLFTVDEETGLNGAKALEPGFIKGRILINLDSEDEGVFIVGCAGGVDTALTLDVEQQPLSNAGHLFHLVVGGLKGGHSGIDIHKHRANANKIMARTLNQIRTLSPMRLVSISGGSRKNAIPRDARASIWVADADQPALMKRVAQLEKQFREEFTSSEPNLFVNLNPAKESEPPAQALSREGTDKIIRILLGLPHGVAGMSPELDGVVETSCNLATIDLTGDQIEILSSQRSASVTRLEEITASVHAIAELAGARYEDGDAYPPWQPLMDSHLLGRSQKIYRKLYDKDPIVRVIHAGLECAVIGDIYPGMEMISFGPTIQNPHSPDERILIPSIEQVWDFMVSLLEELGGEEF